MLSVLLSLTAMAASDSTADSFSSTTNPSVGTLGDWSFGYSSASSHLPLPNVVTNTFTKLAYWELPGGKPRITKNTGTVDRVSGAVRYQINDYVVLHPKVNQPAVVRFTADAAHELRTPLAALKVHTQNAVRAPSQAERDASLERMLEGLQRTVHLAEQMLDVWLNTKFAGGRHARRVSKIEPGGAAS